MSSLKSKRLAHSAEKEGSARTRLLKAAPLSNQVFRLDRRRPQWSTPIRLLPPSPGDLAAGVVPWIPPLLIEAEAEEGGGRKTDEYRSGRVGEWESGRVRNPKPEADLLENVETHRTDLLAEARKEAEELLTAARLEAAELREKARLQGWQQGREAGLTQGRQEGLAALAPLSQVLEIAVQDVRQTVTNQLARWEEQVVQWAFAVAEKIITVEIQTNRDVVQAAVRDSLNRLQGDDIMLRVNPEEAPLVQEWLASLAPGVPVRVVADPGIERGGCIAATSETAVDAQPSVMLQNLRLALTGED